MDRAMRYWLVSLGLMILGAPVASAAEEFTCSAHDGRSCLQPTANIRHGRNTTFHFRNGCEVPINVEAELMAGDGGVRIEKLGIDPGQEGGFECNWSGKIPEHCIRKVTYLCVKQMPTPGGQQPQTETNSQSHPACVDGRSECARACKIYREEVMGPCLQDCKNAEALCNRNGTFKMPSLAQSSIDLSHKHFRGP